MAQYHLKDTQYKVASFITERPKDDRWIPSIKEKIRTLVMYCKEMTGWRKNTFFFGRFILYKEGGF